MLFHQMLPCSKSLLLVRREPPGTDVIGLSEASIFLRLPETQRPDKDPELTISERPPSLLFQQPTTRVNLSNNSLVTTLQRDRDLPVSTRHHRTARIPKIPRRVHTSVHDQTRRKAHGRPRASVGLLGHQIYPYGAVAIASDLGEVPDVAFDVGEGGDLSVLGQSEDGCGAVSAELEFS